MRPLDIWIFTIGEPLPLKNNVRLHRTGMLCEHLRLKGHKIIWWTSAFDHINKKMLFNSDKEIILSSNYIVKLIKGLGYNKNISIRRLLDHYFLSVKFRRYFSKLSKPDIILTSIPCYYISYEAVKYAKKSCVPVITDLRDLWPDIFQIITRSKKLKRILQFILSYDYMKLKYSFRHATSLVAISDSYLSLSAERGKRSISHLDKCFLLGTEPFDEKNCVTNMENLIKFLKDKKVFVYVGSFGLTYELSILVEAAKFFELKDKNVIFLIIGKGDQEIILREVSLTHQNIISPGWLEYLEIRTCLKYSKVGLMPYISYATQSIPNKFFDYVAMGLPVISSLNSADMKRLINQYKLGFNYNAGDVKRFIEICNDYIDNESLLKEHSQNAKAFFNKHGNSEKIYQKYAKHIEDVAISYK